MASRFTIYSINQISDLIYKISYIIYRQPRHDVTLRSNQIVAILEVKTVHGNHYLFNNKVTMFCSLMNFFYQENRA